MNINYNKKLKTAVIASVMALGFNSLCYASYDDIYDTYNPTRYDRVTANNIDLSRPFELTLSRDTVSYFLYYTPTDRVIDGQTLKGGELYYVIRDGNNDSGTYDIQYHSLGKFNSSMSEDEIKDLISNVEGDQTVNGSQTVTGQQQVQGGLFILKLR